jgi:hypothetical protein
MLRLFETNMNHREDDKAHEIADRTASAILQRLDETVERMSSAELKGYVRALARPIVCAEAQQLAECKDWIERVVEQTVHRVMRVCKTLPMVAIPAPHVARRAA